MKRIRKGEKGTESKERDSGEIIGDNDYSNEDKTEGKYKNNVARRD